MIEFWAAMYGAVATAVAVAASIGANRMLEPGVPGPDDMGEFAVLAGLLWPVTVIGVAEAGMIVAIQQFHRTAVQRGSLSSIDVADPRS